jgi:plasmid maintenance system antidote protein VapI
MLIAVHDPNLILDGETAAKLGHAFDVSPEYWTNLDRAWRLGPHPI